MPEIEQIRVEQVSLAPRSFTQASGPLPDSIAWLLQDLSFRIQTGERVAIVGPSGSGKTSLLRLLNRLSEPTRGTIYWQQTPYCEIPVVQLRQQVGLVLQESKLLGKTVQQTLEYPLELRQLDRKLIRQRVGEWVERLHIPLDWLDRNELQLSVGQRQLVAIARALVSNPSVLLLDEPTSALDVGRGERVLTLLRDLASQGQLTPILVSHQLDQAKQFASRVLHLQDGKLIQDSPAETMDWESLRQQLIAAETRRSEEWD